MTAKRAPADVLREARKRDSLTKRSRVLAALDEMKAKGEEITFLSVARAAGVSNWLVYAEGVREHIEAARKSQASATARDRKTGSTASAASLAIDLELNRAELRKLREERDRLKAAVQRGLGQQVQQAPVAELVARIQELTTQLQQRDSELTAARAEADTLRAELEDAQDSLGGLRASLKQMMRDQNAPTVH
ncbi:DUF6262 family protein [Streptomyces sp. NBC_01800]|nr:DUF6262 family protein [Streptomyces sp. NBC_01800]